MSEQNTDKEKVIEANELTIDDLFNIGDSQEVTIKMRRYLNLLKIEKMVSSIKEHEIIYGNMFGIWVFPKEKVIQEEIARGIRLQQEINELKQKISKK
jgi:hypothetical protein